MIWSQILINLPNRRMNDCQFPTTIFLSMIASSATHHKYDKNKPLERTSLVTQLPAKKVYFVFMAIIPWGRRDRERKAGREDAQKFDLTREWVSGRVREATRGRRSLSDRRHDNPRLHVLTCAVDFGGTCRRLARNGLCFRDSLALGTVCGKKFCLF